MSRFNLTQENVYSQPCYDATWALAYALNSTLNDAGEIYHTYKYIYTGACPGFFEGVAGAKRLRLGLMTFGLIVNGLSKQFISESLRYQASDLARNNTCACLKCLF